MQHARAHAHARSHALTHAHEHVQACASERACVNQLMSTDNRRLDLMIDADTREREEHRVEVTVRATG